MMSDLLTHIERSELVDVDLDKEPACEGWGHPLNSGGHDGGAAKFRVVCPGCRRLILQCAGHAAWLRAFPTLRCGYGCGAVATPDEFGFIEL